MFQEPKFFIKPKFLRDTRYPNGLPIGEAVITSGGNLKATYVIHTVGPKYKFDENPQQLLKNCYINSFLLADKYKCKSIAFPSISTGVYDYPKEEASEIAYKVISNLLPKAIYIKDVIFVFYSQEDSDILQSFTKSADE